MKLDLSSCCVRDFTAGDAAALVRYANNRKISRYMRDRFPHPYTLRDAASFIEHVQQQSPPTVWAIDVAGQAVGSIGLLPRSDIERVSAEIGYWLGEPFWGRGIMTEALQAVTVWALKDFQLTRIYALPFATNAASCRVLEKAGYVCEGRLQKSAIKDGQVVDQFMYACIVGDETVRSIVE
ncbi:MAG TPA: GNAT family N-acetyltransferase [Pirellulaceae bacterium]|nr:GNAT family N-acetyltransferase [Pirellulaceae bacterium]